MIIIASSFFCIKKKIHVALLKEGFSLTIQHWYDFHISFLVGQRQSWKQHVKVT